jgi:phage shock protein E
MRVAMVLLVAAFASPALAKEPPAKPNQLIDYRGFAALTAEVEPIREARRIPLEAFQAMARGGEALLLDARSADAFRRGHIEGAVNLPFTDFTAESLARVVGANRNRPILIYCNNNFSNNVDPVPTKMIRVALNIQTFINLHGYGYANVYELADVVDFNDPAVRWVKG